MEHAEVPLENAQEEIMHHAHGHHDRWVMGVALTAAILAVCAAITSLMAEHHANEAMIEQIGSSDQWSYYQAKSIKGKLAALRIDVLQALGKPVETQDAGAVAKYEKDQEAIQEAAKEKEHAAQQHMRHHTWLSMSVTMFQVAIAVSAIAVLTRRKSFWYGSLGFGATGLGFLLWSFLLHV